MLTYVQLWDDRIRPMGRDGVSTKKEPEAEVLEESVDCPLHCDRRSSGNQQKWPATLDHRAQENLLLPMSNYGRKGATAFTAGGRHFCVTVDSDSDSMLSRRLFASGQRARRSAGHPGDRVRVLGTAGPPSGFDCHGHSNGSSAP